MSSSSSSSSASSSSASSSSATVFKRISFYTFWIKIIMENSLFGSYCIMIRMFRHIQSRLSLDHYRILIVWNISANDKNGEVYRVSKLIGSLFLVEFQQYSLLPISSFKFLCTYKIRPSLKIILFMLILWRRELDMKELLLNIMFSITPPWWWSLIYNHNFFK